MLFSIIAIKVRQLKINTDLVPEEVHCCLGKFKRVKLLRDFVETRQVSKLKARSYVVLKCPVPLVCTEKFGVWGLFGMKRIWRIHKANAIRSQTSRELQHL